MTTRRPHATLLLLCLAITAPVIAQDEEIGELTPQDQLRALLAQGQQQLAAGENDAAAQTLTVVISAFERAGSYNPIPYTLRAKAFAELEEYQPALEDLKKALQYKQQQPQYEPEIRNTRAEVYLELGAPQQALPDAQEATKLNRSNPNYQFNLGKALIGVGNPADASKALSRYLEAPLPDEAEPNNEKRAEALLLRGRANAFLRQADEARADVTASLDLDPDNHEAFVVLGQVALIEQDYETAAAEYGRAIANYEPANPQDDRPFIEGMLTRASALEEMGKQLGRQGDRAGAETAYQASLQQTQELLVGLDPDSAELAGSRAATLFRMAVAHRLLGDLGAAVKEFSQALQLNPAFGDAYFRRGICFHYLEEYQLAIRDFEQASSINFDIPRANLWKGMSYAKQAEYAEAIRAYGESIAVSDRYIPAYINRGLAHLAEEDYTKAIDDFNEAIRLQPTEAMHYLRRGYAQTASGDSETAIRSYQKAIERNSQLKPAYDALIQELDASGRVALAAEYRQRAARLGL